MWKLFKYEMRKSMPGKRILIAITLSAELMVLIGLGFGNISLVGIGALLLSYSALIGMFITCFGGSGLFGRELRTKQSYMLFITPNSNRKILDAKYLESFCSSVLMGIYFLLLLGLDLSLTVIRGQWSTGPFSNNFQGLQEVSAMIPNAALALLSLWFLLVAAAFFIAVVFASIFSKLPAKGLLGFLFFLFLGFLINLLGSVLTTVSYSEFHILVLSLLFLLGGLLFRGATLFLMKHELNP